MDDTKKAPSADEKLDQLQSEFYDLSNRLYRETHDREAAQRRLVMTAVLMVYAFMLGVIFARASRRGNRRG